ncbi:MAG: hypothetical protein U0T69_11420 [Chitinophagales bacterium]
MTNLVKNTETTHTQGDGTGWVYVFHKTIESFSIMADAQRGKRICSLHLNDAYRVSFEEHEANAKLIAAAPDLLEALKEARKSLQFLAERGYWNAESATMIQIKEAIDKATK